MNTQPRRKWHPQRWLLLLAASLLAYAGWTQYAFRSALKEAKALEWWVNYTEPVEEIRKNWKNTFRKETWLDGVTGIAIPTGEELERHHDIVHRLNPKGLTIYRATNLRDLAALKGLTRLDALQISSGYNLTNVDMLKNLPELKRVQLTDCTALTNVDALKTLTALEELDLGNCMLLTNVDALKSLPTLHYIALHGCLALTNVDALKGITALKRLDLTNCSHLKNVDALKNLKALETVVLKGCTGLTKESIEALKAAIPKTIIFTD